MLYYENVYPLGGSKDTKLLKQDQIAIFVPMQDRVYIAIDLKSFYASVECVERGLDPLTANLVVADPTRTEKTICLAVSPSLKSYGIAGRARLFEVVQRVGEINRERRRNAPGRRLTRASSDNSAVCADPSLELGYIVAPPRMSLYMQVSRRIYEIYLKYISSEDIHVYSVDEVFIDATQYTRIYGCSAHELALRMIRDVLSSTGITATAGIGPNLYLAKIAMDIEAKHQKADADGVRIAELDEMSFRRKYWTHRPLTDFWRLGRGTAERLEKAGLYTLGDVARCSVGKKWEHYNEDLLYKIFGVNAELLIDHAWGWESCTIADIKAYRPSSNSLSIGQVLKEPYDWAKARNIVKEMTDLLVMDQLVSKHLVTDQLVLTVGYDSSSLEQGGGKAAYGGPVTYDYYGRPVPKPAHGTIRLDGLTSSTKLLTDAMTALYDRITDKSLTVRRIYVVAGRVLPESEAAGIQLGLFDEQVDTTRERRRQEAILQIRRRFGKNAILKGINFEEGATTRERNEQIGGHKA